MNIFVKKIGVWRRAPILGAACPTVARHNVRVRRVRRRPKRLAHGARPSQRTEGALSALVASVDSDGRGRARSWLYPTEPTVGERRRCVPTAHSDAAASSPTRELGNFELPRYLYLRKQNTAGASQNRSKHAPRNRTSFSLQISFRNEYLCKENWSVASCSYFGSGVSDGRAAQETRASGAPTSKTVGAHGASALADGARPSERAEGALSALVASVDSDGRGRARPSTLVALPNGAYRRRAPSVRSVASRGRERPPPSSYRAHSANMRATESGSRVAVGQKSEMLVDGGASSLRW